MNKADKKKAFKQLVKSIERSNKKFDKATPAERILMVCKDVLDLLKLDRIQAEQGTYVSIPISNEDGVAGCQVSDILKDTKLPTCSVCAIGGAVYATILRLNEVQVGSSNIYGDGSDVRIRVDYHTYPSGDMDGTASHKAREVFPDELLRCMEYAFERGCFGYGMIIESKDRLKAIYKNLIKNKGKQFTNYGSARGHGVIWKEKDLNHE